MDPERMRQLEAKLKNLFDEGKEDSKRVDVDGPSSASSDDKVVIRRRKGISRRLVS